jgi:hypothetical protein
MKPGLLHAGVGARVGIEIRIALGRRKGIAALALALLAGPVQAQTVPACDGGKTALVLSGGGAKGIAHIPVLRLLDSLGVVPDLIVGTSIGSGDGGALRERIHRRRDRLHLADELASESVRNGRCSPAPPLAAPGSPCSSGNRVSAGFRSGVPR